MFLNPSAAKASEVNLRDKTWTAGVHAAHIILELIFVNNIRNGAYGRIQTGLTFLI